MSSCLLGKSVKVGLSSCVDKQQVDVEVRDLFGMGANIKQSKVFLVVIVLSNDLY